MSIVLQGSTSGSITLQEPAVAGSTVLDLPATSGTVLTSASPSSDLPSSINGPAFRATLSTNQTVSANTNTKIAFNVETWDTASCFNNTGSTVGSIPSYSFLPNVAGYYQVNCVLSTGGGAVSYLFPMIYLNNAIYAVGTRIDTPSSANCYSTTLSDMVYLNGTTDYISFFGYTSGTTFGSGTGDNSCKFSASLVRAA